MPHSPRHGRLRKKAEVALGGDRCANGCRKVSLDRADLSIAVGVALAVLVIYLVTLAPGLLQDDSAEMQTQAVTLGYAHPTGYPVYLLIAKLSTFIPVGEVAYRVNLLSAVMGSLAAGLVYVLGRLLTGMRWVAVVGAVGLAVSPTLWSQAVIAEVYTSSVVCTVGVLLGLERWRQTGGVGWLLGAACLGGVSLGVHVTVALMAPAALLMVALRMINITPGQRGFLCKTGIAAVAGAVTGVAITLAAFAVIDRADSPTSYFRTVINPSRSEWDLQPEDLDGFFDRVKLSMSAPQFAGLLTSQPPAVTRQKTIDYAVNLAREFPLLWLVLAIAGLFWLGRRNMPMTLVLTLTYVTHLCYDLQFDGVVHVMYIATYVPIGVLGIAGLAAVCDGCRDLATRFGPTAGAVGGDSVGDGIQLAQSIADGVASHKPRRTSRTFDPWVALVGLGVIAWPMLLADAWKDGRRNFWLPPGEEDAFQIKDSPKFHREVRQLIKALEPNALVFTGWCTLYPYYYVARIEQGRTDLQFIQYDPHPGQKELAKSAVEHIQEVLLKRQRPVYFTVPAEYFDRAGKKLAELFEVGPVRRGRETLYRVREKGLVGGG